MRVTIDSSEPLASTLRVVGAMYGVELTTSDGSPASAAESPETPAAPTSSRRRGGRAKKASAAAPRPDAKVIREWAVGNGYEVSTRGQLSKAVLEAYSSAN